MPGIDFSQRYSDYARFLPAVSEMYTRFVVNPNPKRPVETLPVSQEDLDFFSNKTNLWYLPCSLYSAGQAAKTSGATKRLDMITGRQNTNTVVLGDSGGFQIQQGSIKFKGDETRERMMRWLEEFCDWSMILDFPTGGINMGTIDVHYDRLVKDGDTYEMQAHEFKKTASGDFKLDKDGNRIKAKDLGVKALNITEFAEQMGLRLDDLQERGFATCMFQTLINNEYFVKNRKVKATNFLNVIQGRTVEESDAWYEKVKHFSDPAITGDAAFEGWSLAGPHKEKFDMTLKRLLDFRRDGLLEGKNWMHILGVGKLANGCAYTTMQRMIRKHDNPEFTISYDVSSPFTTAAYGNLFMGSTLDKQAWTIQSEKLDGREFLETYNTEYKTSPIMRKNRYGLLEAVKYRGDENFLDVLEELWIANMKGNPGPNSRFVRTEIGKRLKMKDICVNDDPELTSTWDVVTYAYMMNHNVQVHLESVFESQDLYDKADPNRVPLDYLMMKEAIEEILDPATKNPLALIDKHRDYLNCLASDKVTAGVMMTSFLDQPPIPDHNKSVKLYKENTKRPKESFVTFDGLFQGM